MISFERYIKEDGDNDTDDFVPEEIADENELTAKDINDKIIEINNKFYNSKDDTNLKNSIFLELNQLYSKVKDDFKSSISLTMYDALKNYYGTQYIAFLTPDIINFMIRNNIASSCRMILHLYFDIYTKYPSSGEKFKVPPQIINYILNSDTGKMNNKPSWVYYLNHFFFYQNDVNYFNLIPKEFLAKASTEPDVCYNIVSMTLYGKKSIAKNPDIIPHELFEGISKKRDILDNFLVYVMNNDNPIPKYLNKWVEFEYGSNTEERIAYFNHQINHKLSIPKVLLLLLKSEILDEHDFGDKALYYIYLLYSKDLNAGQVFNTLSFEDIRKVDDYCDSIFNNVIGLPSSMNPKMLFFSSLGSSTNDDCAVHYMDYKINQPDNDNEFEPMFTSSLQKHILDSLPFCKLIVKNLNDENKFKMLISLFTTEDKFTKKIIYSTYINDFITRIALHIKTKTFFKLIDNIAVTDIELLEKFLSNSNACCMTLINLLRKYKKDTNDEITEIEILLRIIENTSESATAFVPRMIKSMTSANQNSTFVFVSNLILKKLITNVSDIPKDYLDYILSVNELSILIIISLVKELNITKYYQISYLIDGIFTIENNFRYRQLELNNFISNLDKNGFDLDTIPFEKYKLEKEEIRDILDAFSVNNLEIPERLKDHYINSMGESSKFFKKNPDLLFAIISNTPKTLRKLDDLPEDRIEELKKHKDELSDNFIKLTLLPKLMANKYNSIYHGAFIHATPGIKGTVDTYVAGKTAEFCVSTLRANTTFHAPKGSNVSSVILIGFGKVEYLFDFDAFSLRDPNTNKRFATRGDMESEELHKTDKEKDFASAKAFGKAYNEADHYDEGFVNFPESEILLAVINDDLINKNDNKQFRQERIEMTKQLKKLNPNIKIISNTRFEQIRNSDELLKGLYQLQQQAEDEEIKKEEEKYAKYYKESLAFDEYMEIKHNGPELISEKLYGNTGWVFHRTETNPEKSVLLSQGIKHGKNKSAFYGTGLYTTYSLDSQLNTDMIRKYGRYIIKGKVNMSGFAIFEPSIFYVVYPGNKNFYKYIRSLGVSHDDYFEYYEISEDRPVIMKEGKQSSDVAKKYWQMIKLKGYNGMIFEGRQDGKVAVIWNRRNFIPYAYAESQPFGRITDPAWISDWKSLKANYSKILSKKKYKYDEDAQTEKVKFIPTKKSNRVEKKVRDKGGIEYNEYDSFGRIIHQLEIERKAGLPDDIWEQWGEYDSEGNYTYRKLNKKNISTEHWYFANSADDAKKFINIVHPASKKPWLNIPKHYRVSDIKDGYISKDEELNSWYKSEVKESLSFEKYIIMEDKVEIPLERAYELFKTEYDKATGQSWTYQKFLQRAGNWEFYGDMDGFVAIRKQNSGFVKFVGMAGSMKSKYKGFKEVVALGFPLWAMVSKDIADMCKRTGMRSPNTLEMFAIKKALLSNPAIMGDAKVINYLADGGVEIDYPDIGRTIKYFVATPAYYTKARKMLIKV